MPVEVHAAEPNIVAERVSDRAEKGSRLGRSAQVPHVSGENLKKGLELVRAERGRRTRLLWPAHLAAHFGVQSFPDQAWITPGNLQNYRDLVMRPRKIHRQLGPAAKL